jgi:hypothetical protein
MSFIFVLLVLLCIPQLQILILYLLLIAIRLCIICLELFAQILEMYLEEPIQNAAGIKDNMLV